MVARLWKKFFFLKIDEIGSEGYLSVSGVHVLSYLWYDYLNVKMSKSLTSLTINIICIVVKNEFTKSLFVKTPYICEDPLYKNSPICLGLFGLTWPHFWRRPDFYSFYKRALNWYFPCKWKCYVTIYYSINIHTYNIHRGLEQMIKHGIRFTSLSCP